jgi:hypothetical protein
MAAVLTLEFTIEPFVAGHPGPHVLEAVAAAEALGASVEFGPFGSTCTVPVERAGEISRAIIDTAFAHGATFVTLSAATEGASPVVPSRVEPSSGEPSA